jgi:mannose-6-phosphate isomerase-like protein (cupin superfamily)
MHWMQGAADAVVRDVRIHEGDGAIRTRTYFPGISRLPVRWAVWELAPGVSEGSHVHDGEETLEEIYYFLEGDGVLWIDGEDLPVTAGDAVLAPPGSDHGFRNTGDGPLRVLLIWGTPAPEAAAYPAVGPGIGSVTTP